mgnify:CR=1 FL=1
MPEQLCEGCGQVEETVNMSIRVGEEGERTYGSDHEFCESCLIRARRLLRRLVSIGYGKRKLVKH